MTLQSILRIQREPTPDRAHLPPPPQPRRCDQCKQMKSPAVLFTAPPTTRWGAPRLLCQTCLGLPQTAPPPAPEPRPMPAPRPAVAGRADKRIGRGARTQSDAERCVCPRCGVVYWRRPHMLRRQRGDGSVVHVWEPEQPGDTLTDTAVLSCERTHQQLRTRDAGRASDGR